MPGSTPASIIATGLNIDFFDSAYLEDLNSQDEDAIIAHKVLQVLMMGHEQQGLFNWQTVEAVLLLRNHSLTRALRLAFQNGFNHIFKQLENQTLNPLQQKQAEFFIANCLAYLPFSDPTAYEAFSIPQWIDGQWEMVTYKVNPLELTPTSGFKKLFLSDNDRVFAYGFEPINNKNASPLLVFMGTTYPAGQGFFSQINTDLEAFETAGKKLYRSGHRRILAWLDKQDKKAKVCGVSLGGALALLLALHKGEKIEEVNALNPPGLYEPSKKSEFDNWDNCTAQPKVYIQKQKGDLVSSFGAWKKEWQVLEVTAPKNKEASNAFLAHALNYAGFADTEFKQINPEEDNKERKTRNFWLYTVLRSAFYYAILVPFRYVVLPLIRFPLNHKLQVLFFIPLFLLLLAAPFLGFGFSLANTAVNLIVNALLPALFGSYALQGLAKLGLSKMMDKSYQSGIADAFQAVNNSQGKILIYLALVSCLLVLLTILSINPAAAIPVLLMLSGAIIVVKVCLSILDGIKTFLGKNDLTDAECHSPLLPRNKQLDLYQQQLEKDFTLGELKNYYHVTRCLLKNKEFIAQELKERKPKKYAILSACLDESKQKEKVRVKTSLAKISRIEQINRFGLYRNSASDETLASIKAIDEDYRKGKLEKTQNMVFLT